mgnify:CR=1 FL=1
MLLEFGARNFFSFKEGFCFSLELNGNCPEEISKGEKVSRVTCLKGANASGKTNVLRTLSFIKYLCTESYNSAPKSEIPFNCFFDSSDTTNLFCRFSIDDINYLYEVELNKNNILSEELSVDESEKFIFKRVNEKIIHVDKDFKELEQLKIRNNVSIIHSAKQGEFYSLNKFFEFFDKIFTNVSDEGLNNYYLLQSPVCEEYRAKPESFEKVKEILKKADTGVVDVKIARLLSPKGVPQYYPCFIHEANGKRHSIGLWHESSGTRKLFYELYLYFVTLQRGGVLLLDEFDINLHPDLLPMLVDLFDSSETNPLGAQMIFSTHDTAIMDRLGKYRTYLVNKQNNESFGYRLDEIPGDILKGDLRNDRPISQWYRKGKLGGVPQTV